MLACWIEIEVFIAKKCCGMSESYRKILLSDSGSILDALRIIDDARLQIALVVNNTGKLVGTVTDGDVRRGILEGVLLDEPVTKIMSFAPLTASENMSKNEMIALMIENEIRHLPIVDNNGSAVGIVHIDKLIGEDVENCSRDDNVCQNIYDNVSVVLMLGGLGSRLLPLTKDVPKPMIEIGGKPLLETIIENFSKQGFRNFYFSVNYKADVIKSYFGDGSAFGVTIKYVNEYKRMGTAGALSLLPDGLEGLIIVMNGDILTNSNFSHLVDFHCQTKAVATMCVREYQQKVPYGVVQTIGTKLRSIVEKPSNTFFVNAGIYVLDTQVLDLVPKDKYFDMPELFDVLDKEDLDSAVFPIREYWLDIGSVHDLERGRAEYDKVFKAVGTLG